ncbi:hypothetical protein V2J09_013600 [Rumex salicifolius]
MSIKSTMATVLKQLIIRSPSINVLLAIFFYKSHQTSLNFQYTIVAFFFDSTFSRNSLLKIQLKSLLRFSIVGRVVIFGVCLQISNLERQKSGAHHCYHSRKYDSGSCKRKKKQRIEELIQSQRGALNKFRY